MGEGREGWDARCAVTAAVATLSHPVVVVALVLLVVNDHLLKRTWPGWVTGKLSDIAWPLVAAPLVAIVLAPLAGWMGRQRWTLGAVLLTGVPLVAANVAPAAAAWIASLLTIVVGPSTITTDPTDLVVILPALYACHLLLVASVARGVHDEDGAAASHRTPEALGSGRAQRRIGWLSVPLIGLAAFGTVATSCDESGVPAVVALEAKDGALFADVNGRYAVSHDGGRSWEPFDGDDVVEVDREQRGPWLNRPSEEHVCIGQRCYRIDGFGIQASDGDESWQTLWRPLHTREAFLERQRRGGSCPETRPPVRALDLELVEDRDSPTGHLLVVAMGPDGAMVGDGRTGFDRVAVLAAVPPAEAGLSRAVLAPELAAASWLAGLVWTVGSVVWWIRLRHLHEPGRRRPMPLWPILVTVFVPLVITTTGQPFGVAFFLVEVLFAWWLSTPIAWAMIVGAAIGWVIYPTPRDWRHVPWKLAARSAVIGVAVLLPFVLWALGPIAHWAVATLLAVVLVPVAAVVPLGARLTPPEREHQDTGAHDGAP